MVKKFLILSLAVLTTQINLSFAKDKVSDLEKACNKGDSKSCVDLGVMYDEGLGVKQNYQLAVELFKKACDLGNGLGCNNLGVMYAKGQGVEQNYQLAFELYKKACDLGNGLGCSNLGSMYFYGQGVEQNYQLAFELYKKACDLGNGLGCSNLGSMYVKGLGVKQNYQLAFELYKKACDLGSGLGCKNLGVMYEKGLGVEQNYQLAFELYKKACDLGDRNGCEYYKEMASYNESNESPKPLGLEVGRTTINEVKKKYALTYLGTDNNMNGEFYKISKKDIPIEGVIDNVLIFDKKGILHTLILKFNETYWDKLFNSLKEKYNLVESNVPFVGDRSATFKSGNTIIYLTSPHLGFEIELMYASEYYVNLISNKLKKQDENKQKKLKDNL